MGGMNRHSESCRSQTWYAVGMKAEIRAKYETLSPEIRTTCLEVWETAHAVAASDTRIGPLTEALKWGEPSLLTNTTKSGTTLRIWQTKDGQSPAIFVNCQTSLVQHIRDIYPNTFKYQGNRAIVLGTGDQNDSEALEHCIHLTLTYHLWK